MWFGAADSSSVEVALIGAVWTFLGVVVMTLGTIAVQAYKNRSERTTSSPPPIDSGLMLQLAERTAVHTRRLDDTDDALEMQDRAMDAYGDRIEALERYNDRIDPGWRTR